MKRKYKSSMSCESKIGSGDSYEQRGWDEEEDDDDDEGEEDEGGGIDRENEERRQISAKRKMAVVPAKKEAKRQQNSGREKAEASLCSRVKSCSVELRERVKR